MFYSVKFILNDMIAALKHRLLIILAFEHCHYEAVIIMCGSIAVGFGIKHS